MEPEKFENKVKNLLEEREIKPSSHSWEQLEQRLERKEKVSKPYLRWIAAVAAVAVIVFTLNIFYNAPVSTDTPQLVEEPVDNGIWEEKTMEPEILQVAATEEEPEEKKASEKEPSENIIFEIPVKKASEEETLLASEISPEAPETIKVEKDLLLAEHQPEAVEHERSFNSDLEVEALLLLATAELKADPTFTVSSGDLLHQVEYELDQSFRQKVFEVVKDGISKAKTAVANRDF